MYRESRVTALATAVQVQITRQILETAIMSRTHQIMIHPAMMSLTAVMTIVDLMNPIILIIVKKMDITMKMAIFSIIDGNA